MDQLRKGQTNTPTGRTTAQCGCIENRKSKDNQNSCRIPPEIWCLGDTTSKIIRKTSTHIFITVITIKSQQVIIHTMWAHQAIQTVPWQPVKESSRIQRKVSFSFCMPLSETLLASFQTLSFNCLSLKIKRIELLNTKLHVSRFSLLPL